MGHGARAVSGCGRARRVLGVAVVLPFASAAGGAAPAGAAVPAPAATLAMLLDAHVVRAAPRADARRVTTVAGRRPLTHVRTVLPVLGRATAAAGGVWLRVALPGRPNGSTGWITADRTRARSTVWSLSVRLGARRVVVTERGRVVRRFGAVVGAPATPTPTGRFFIEEGMSLRPGAAGGPFALATSARSNVLQEFDGGPGQIGLHGMNGLSGALGTASSHGCIRLGAGAITWLAQRIGAGVPLIIRR